MVTRLLKNGVVKKQLSVDVSQEIWVKVRDVAAKNKTPITTWLRELINRELKKVEQFGK